MGRRVRAASAKRADEPHNRTFDESLAAPFDVARTRLASQWDAKRLAPRFNAGLRIHPIPWSPGGTTDFMFSRASGTAS
jgi:hypothetical protein